MSRSPNLSQAATIPESSDVRQTTSAAPFETGPGRAHPLGATVDNEGVNFSVFSRHATAVELLLLGQHDDLQPLQVIKLEPLANQTFFAECLEFWVREMTAILAVGTCQQGGRRRCRLCQGRSPLL